MSKRLATGRAIRRARGVATRLGAVAAFALAAVLAGTEARATDWYTGAAPPPPDENWIVAVDPSISFTTNSSRFEGVSGTFAATDTLRVTGARIRVEGLEGAYDYRIAGQLARVHGHQIEGGVLGGYEWIWRNASLSGYVGLNVRDTIVP